MSRRRPEPPPGYLSTSRAAELLRTSDSYVRRLARQPADGGLPVLASVVLRSDGGGEYRYVLQSDVEKFRNVRLRRAGGSDDPEPLVDHGAVGVGAGSGSPGPAELPATKRGDQSGVETGSTPTDVASGSGVLPGGDWQLELDLATSNARLNEMALRVETLERLNEQLTLHNTFLQRRLGELDRAQMQLLDGYLVNNDGT
jgi:hypothetical protein